MGKLKPTTFITKSGTEILLRSPEAGEGEQLIKTVKRNLETSEHTLTRPDEFNCSPEQEDNIIKNYLESPGKIMIAAYRASQPIGLLNLEVGHRKRNSHVGEFGMAIFPEFRNQGIGRQMLQSLLFWAKAEPGLEKVQLKVHARNKGAINLYQKLGFQTEGTEIRGVKLDEHHYDDVIQMALFVK